MYKQFKFLAPIMMILLLVSCGKSDESKKTGSIIGTWELKSITQDGQSIMDFTGMEKISATTTVYSKDENLEVIFDEATMTSTGQYTTISKITTNGETITTEDIAKIEKETVNYRLEGDKIIFDQNSLIIDEEYPEEINKEDLGLKYEVKGNELRIYQEISQEQSSEYGNVKFELLLNLIFTRK